MKAPLRLVVVGAPKSGKSTFARSLRLTGTPTFCTDPRSLVPEPEEAVTYLPEGLDWSGASAYVADVWFRMPGPWCIEGVATVRALRKWSRLKPPCDHIVVFDRQFEHAITCPGQRAMAKAVATVWEEIEHRFRHLTSHR